MGAPVWPANLPALDGALAAAHLTLGDAAFTSAWATGQNLPLEQVVSHALAAPEGPTDMAEPTIGE